MVLIVMWLPGFVGPSLIEPPPDPPPQPNGRQDGPGHHFKRKRLSKQTLKPPFRNFQDNWANIRIVLLFCLIVQRNGAYVKSK